jgi:hypothetical protein
MSEGSPDYTNNVRLLALAPDGSLTTIACDAAGRLVAALYGGVSLEGPLDVNQVDSNRNMRGLDGATLRTIMVDAAGRIVSVMTGDHDGTPIILAVDANGNITATMTAEYGGDTVTLQANAAHQLITVLQDAQNLFGEAYDFGLGELAVRLGSPSVFERRGSMMWFDDFRHGLGRWTPTLSGAGSATALSNLDAKFGGFSALLTAGPAENRYARLAHYEAVFKTSAYIAVEISFQTQNTNAGSYELVVEVLNGTDGYKFAINCETLTDYINRWTAAGGWATVGAHTIESEVHSWTTLKLVVDLAAGEYRRLYVNGTKYNLLGLVGETWEQVSTPSIAATFTVTSLGAASAAALLDNVIITVNEPAV